MKVEYINPFVLSATSILEQVAQLKVTRGEVSLRPRMFSTAEVSVLLGVTGDVEGQVIYGLSRDTALAIAKRMMSNLTLEGFDEVACSAIGELGNMITGHATGILEKEGIVIRISSPAIITGQQVSVSSTKGAILGVPLESEAGTLEINVSLQSVKKSAP